jgi:hypothetical protein
MTIELSTEQLRRLSDDGTIRVFLDKSEQFTEIAVEDLDITLSELAAGTPGHTPNGIEIRY